jgi:hypothetical protein
MTAPARDFQSGGDDAALWVPGKLGSLWDIMKLFDVDGAESALTALVLRTQALATKEGADAVPDEWMEEIRLGLSMTSKIAQRAKLTETIEMIGRLTIDFATEVVACDAVRAGLHHLYGLMKSEMRKRAFFIVDQDKRDYYREIDLVMPPDLLAAFGPRAPTSAFGAKVDVAFPSARISILEAGNAIAFGMNNAAGYHLVRVAEVGLRVLAWDRRVEAKNRSGSAIPLELAEWGYLIQGVETKVKLIQGWKSTLVREEAHQFYNRFLVEVRAFNDGWRRHIAHNRSHNYHDDEIFSLWGHVRRFMETMVTCMSQSKRMPIVWRAVPKS